MEIDYTPVDETLSSLKEPSLDVMITPITMVEILYAQLNHRFRSNTFIRLNEGEGLAFEIDDNGLLVRTVNPDSQIVVTHSHKKRALMLKYRPKQAAHLGGRKLYNRLKRHFYWPALFVDCYVTVRNCP